MSSNEIAVSVINLSKRYEIYHSPRDRLKQFVLPRLRRLAGKRLTQYFQEFWALKDVSFEVKKGETVGIIGRNGSGKSTLLQMICGTLNPTSGIIQTSGRIAALLELGSGFNPEFTGRENVYMNASVLGLSQAEIDACFGDIAAFADIGEFIEQPVKTYSSGMYVRLAFSVAVHTKPDIFIVDEALSVGDIAFQNKCMRKIKQLKQGGTSILFVSHDLSTVQIVCDRAIWLKSGHKFLEGDPVNVCQEYYADMVGAGSGDAISATIIPQQSTGVGRFSYLSLKDGSGTEKKIFEVKEDIDIEFELILEADTEETIFAISIYRADGEWVVGQTSREAHVVWPRSHAGGKLGGTLRLNQNCLAPGDYRVALGAYSKDHAFCYALTDLALSLSVRADYQIWGRFVHPCEWRIEMKDVRK